MLKKRLLSLALFLALVLCASCAFAADFFYDEKQTHLMPESGSVLTFRLAMSPTDALDAQKTLLFQTRAADLRFNTFNQLLDCTGWSFRSSLEEDWRVSYLSGVPMMTQRTEYRLPAGDGFALNTKALLFEANLVDENEKPVDLDGVESSSEVYQDRIPIVVDTVAVADKLGLTSTSKAMVSAAIVHDVNNPQLEDVPWEVPPFAADRFNVNEAGIMFLQPQQDGWDDTPLTPKRIYDDALEFTPLFTLPGEPDFPNYATIYVNGFSPYAFIWTEMELLPAPAPDLPDTGDSASIAPWLLLLGGACALLRRKEQHA